jgi:hypothetical protein
MAAHEWGTPPWLIARRRGRLTERDRLKWFLRWQFYRRQMNPKENED